MRRVIGCMGSLVLLLFTVSIAHAAPTTAWPSQHATLLTFTPPAHTVSNAVAAKNWTFQGCWSARTGSPCLDVYSDPLGDLWICKACGTTGNPGPGKCRRTTQAELDSGLWCS